MKTVSHARLIEVLDYDQLTGEFSWRKRRHGCLRSHIGTASHISGSGNIRYHKIGIDGRQYFAHRLAWFYVHKEWPLEIDHIDGNGLDNRLSNLRSSTRAQNSTNAEAQATSKTKLRGVHYHPGAKRYRAQICKNRKTRHIGYFDSPQQAHAAYLKAARELHGEFVRN